MDSSSPMVTFELRTLEGTQQRYVLYTFAPHWRAAQLRAALAVGAQAMAQVPPDEKLESVFVFGEWEFLDAISLLGQARQFFADPNSDHFVFSSAVGLPGLSRALLRDLMGVMHFYFGNRLGVDFYATLDEALAAMRDRAAARAAVTT